mmetsp:Transcript_98004/g.304766  ORF Transcript_98004/g.304766 Transcript_98004/m.304766 type:complete len:269 (+) Transcript_98004:429-1235(+)
MEEIRFALQRPAPGGESLVLLVEGLDLPILPDLRELRRRARAALGPGFTREEVFKWWQETKDSLYPLEHSKFRRLFESLYSQPALMFGQSYYGSTFLCNCINGASQHMKSFSFYRPKGSPCIRIHAEAGPGRSPEEIETLEFSKREVGAVLRSQSQRSVGERAAASSMNFAAMLYGHENGQLAGNATVIIKLFTAAEWWGPGTSGWTKCDNTWQCRDKVNILGTKVRETGRLLWHLPEAEEAGPAEQPTDIIPAASKHPNRCSPCHGA